MLCQLEVWERGTFLRKIRERGANFQNLVCERIPIFQYIVCERVPIFQNLVCERPRMKSVDGVIGVDSPPGIQSSSKSRL